MVAFSKQVDRPLLITEVSYQSRDGTAQTPWWVDAAAGADEGEQAACYGAALQTLLDEPVVRGVFPWMAYFDPAANPDGFDFIGKQAEAVVANHYGGASAAP